MICTTGTKFKHLNFCIKEGTVHLVFPLSFQYYYVANKIIDSLLVKMRGRISEEMTKKMKRRKSLESKLDDN
jgi:hypothetical protein